MVFHPSVFVWMRRFSTVYYSNFVKGYCQKFSSSSYNKRMLEDIEHQEEIPFRMSENFSPYKASWFTEFFYLFIRGVKNYFRNYRVFLADLCMAIVRTKTNLSSFIRQVLLYIYNIYIYLKAFSAARRLDLLWIVGKSRWRMHIRSKHIG
jgi:hypothetical protein